MARYLDESQAGADGFRIIHEPEQQRYAVYQRVDDPGTDTETGTVRDRLVGEAHYSLRGDDVIDFDHTEVSPHLRGSGLSGLLAHRAVTSDVVADRRVVASCWFIDGYLARHPELLQNG